MEPAARDDSLRLAKLATETLGRDLLESLIEEMKVMPGSWSILTQFQQDKVIEHLRARVTTLMHDTLAIIFRGAYPSCEAELSGVIFKKGIRAVLDISKTAQHRHELCDAVGQHVIIVMANPAQYLERIEEIKAQAQQPDLFAAGSTPDEPESPPPGDAPAGETVDETPDAPAPEIQIDERKMFEDLHGLGLEVAAGTIARWTHDQCVETLTWLAGVGQGIATMADRPYYLKPPHIAEPNAAAAA